MSLAIKIHVSLAIKIQVSLAIKIHVSLAIKTHVSLAIKTHVSLAIKMCFFLMSQGSLNPKIRFLGQKVCSVARERTDRHESDYCGHPFRSFSFNLSSKIGPIHSLVIKIQSLVIMIYRQFLNTVERVFFGIFVKIQKITIFRFFSKNVQPYGFFTALLRTHELLVNNKGNHNESRFGVVA